jgi:hypothetical protein
MAASLLQQTQQAHLDYRYYKSYLRYRLLLDCYETYLVRYDLLPSLLKSL